MEIGPLMRSSEEWSSKAVRNSVGVGEDRLVQLLELRTESGPIYVCPTRWQRWRLRWAFRHFHVLPPQVLSLRNQRLIEKLARTAMVTPDFPVARERVFGVVEKVRLQPTAAAPKAVRLGTEPAEPQRSPAKLTSSNRWHPGLPDRRRRLMVRPEPIPIRPPVATTYSTSRRARFVRDARFQQWGALGVLAAVCVVVILVRFFDPSLLPATGWNPPGASAHVEQAKTQSPPRVNPPLQLVSPSALLPTFARLKPQVALPELQLASTVERPSPHFTASRPLIATSNPMRAANELERISASEPERLFVSELPQGHFAEPVVTDPNLVGELRLKALIGSDGSVKQVTVVSGSPKLAEVGMRAVRRWRYQALDHPGEAETLIRMRFFGEDGVSIASIAK